MKRKDYKPTGKVMNLWTKFRFVKGKGFEIIDDKKMKKKELDEFIRLQMEVGKKLKSKTYNCKGVKYKDA